MPKWTTPRARHSTIGAGCEIALVARWPLFFVDDSEGLLAARALVRRARLLALHHHGEPLVGVQPGAGGDEPSHDDVLLEAAKVVGLARDRGFREDLGGLLEARRGDERLGRE